MTNRRSFIQKLALGSTLAISIPDIVSAANLSSNNTIKLNRDDVVLFQGDSITDAGRDKQETAANTQASLGNGYSALAAAQLLLKYGSLNLHIYNRGISGNKVYQLAERWEQDTLNLKPNVLSILIGVNDFWHTLADKDPYEGTVATYEKDYRALLDYTKKILPDTQLVIGEPFAIKGVKAVNTEWYPAFDEYRAVAKALAAEFNAIFIPYQQVFDEAIQQAPAQYWTGDGVHTTLAGAALMAEAWLKVVSG
ncbi:SGNH/GDSL hydrolase family protein [Olivibacter sp. SDN3]|uniref:SGNH/GDSL hydrolase family protein n=1 Tax=Olivibacter sp. SDN3 TaxID=2764720 RepID=UPI0016510DBB|nr:SGNH/GDSL hydrolase family protein [Olivibacter sp. SDN3]QNL48980.1 SGNH/GDSL hydrolase family protein [Olivibacter sp. SDN3]